jgi:acetoin utilization protein AcuC
VRGPAGQVNGCGRPEGMTDIAIIYHDDFKHYDLGADHPLRGPVCMDGELAFAPVLNHPAVQQKANLRFLTPLEATEADVLAVHTYEYLNFVKGLDETGGLITLDTPMLPGMYRLAKLFAGADMLGAKAVLDGEVSKSFVFGIMGHHVGADFGGGFGVLNDVAIAIDYIRRQYGLKRIMVVDYAANAGHGTESIYYHSPEVLCVDLHQDPLNLYPGKGFPEQVGRGAGAGYTVNVCLPPYSTDEHYLRAMQEIVVPIAYEYRPELVMGVGLNGAHFSVNLNQLMLTLTGLRETVRLLSWCADDLCAGKFVHIGGFSLDTQSLGLGFLATVAGALSLAVDLPEPFPFPEDFPDASEEVENSIQTMKDILKKYWRSLQ